ncbi:hypothetical protein A3I40_01280 [Candidatus Uhrbacteria bacterium RIFCSPLOWO2_02_FULL_48_12]|uniref:t-SNARE coiled-coil homology domain-containing protein n=1 Tax=Candidatus Uhrbacteria bacterium RIFCSPLOWO2_02_FULL_48_12 TaxID=1802407 RepID=A0A1F7V9H1_9BACT|nr:MAG: hypothetical protein A3I40_01280 [Candidatus Uhrbacteria bacterium RIFCSPLOWO2_02_FULL_48_12]
MSEPLTVEHFNKFEKRVDERFDKVDERFDKVDTRFDKVDTRLDKMDKRFDGIDIRLDKVDERFDKVDKALKDNGEILTELKIHMDKRFDKLEKLLMLEERFEQYKERTDIRFRKIGEHLAMPELTV